jgi:hypothetical protein
LVIAQISENFHVAASKAHELCAILAANKGVSFKWHKGFFEKRLTKKNSAPHGTFVLAKVTSPSLGKMTLSM